MGLLKHEADVKTAASTKAVAAGGNGGGGKGGKASRLNPLAVAGGIISAASLAYLLYTYLSTSSSTNRSSSNDDDDDDDIARRRSTSSKPSSSASRPRPSLSLTLSPTFSRTDAACIAGLRTLLTALAPLFVVHLIVRGSDADDLATSLSSLSATLGAIREFDACRMLEYTQPTGRFALSRALACDCHVEVALPGSDEAITVVELAKIRRSCGLVVFASFETQPGGGGKRVLAELARLALVEGRDAPSGMRAFDLGESAEQGKWDELARRLRELRAGWR